MEKGMSTFIASRLNLKDRMRVYDFLFGNTLHEDSPAFCLEMGLMNMAASGTWTAWKNDIQAKAIAKGLREYNDGVIAARAAKQLHFI